MTTAISTSQSTVFVERAIGPKGPVTAVESLVKISGTSGTAISASAP